jgi:hypothetical protein
VWSRSGGLQQASYLLRLIGLDSPYGHGQHHHQRKAATGIHFCQPSDGVLFETEAGVQTAVDPLYLQNKLHM